MPIRGESGPGGGIRLDGSAGVAAVRLSLGEIVSLWPAARLSRETSGLPWSTASHTGLAKLLRGLPASRARELKALCRRVVVGPPAGTAVREGAGAPPRELLRIFEEGFSLRLGLEFLYTDRNGRCTARRVEPHGLLVETPAWYILARDIAKQEPRMFRMDRIARPWLLHDVPFEPDFEVIRSQLPDERRWKPLAR